MAGRPPDAGLSQLDEPPSVSGVRDLWYQSDDTRRKQLTVADQIDQILCDAFVNPIAVDIDGHIAEMSIGCTFTEPTSEVMPHDVASFKLRDDG